MIDPRDRGILGLSPDVLDMLTGHVTLTNFAAMMSAPLALAAQLTAPVTTTAQLAAVRARLPWLDWEQSPTSPLVVPRRGRPRGSFDYTEENKPLFYQRVVEKAVYIVFDEPGIRVNKTNLAKAMVEGETKIGVAINTLGPNLKHLERRISEMAVQGVDRDTIMRTILQELLGN